MTLPAAIHGWHEPLAQGETLAVISRRGRLV